METFATFNHALLPSPKRPLTTLHHLRVRSQATKCSTTGRESINSYSTAASPHLKSFLIGSKQLSQNQTPDHSSAYNRYFSQSIQHDYATLARKELQQTQRHIQALKKTTWNLSNFEPTMAEPRVRQAKVHSNKFLKLTQGLKLKKAEPLKWKPKPLQLLDHRQSLYKDHIQQQFRNYFNQKHVSISQSLQNSPVRPVPSGFHINRPKDSSFTQHFTSMYQDESMEGVRRKAAQRQIEEQKFNDRQVKQLILRQVIEEDKIRRLTIARLHKQEEVAKVHALLNEAAIKIQRAFRKCRTVIDEIKEASEQSVHSDTDLVKDLLEQQLCELSAQANEFVFQFYRRKEAEIVKIQRFVRLRVLE